MNSEKSLQLAHEVVRHFGSWAVAREHAERQPDGTLLIRMPKADVATGVEAAGTVNAGKRVPAAA